MKNQHFNFIGVNKKNYHRFPKKGSIRNIVGNTQNTSEKNAFKALGIFSAPFIRLRTSPVRNNEIERVAGGIPFVQKGFPIRIIVIPEHNIIINVTMGRSKKYGITSNHLFHQGVTIRHQKTDSFGNIYHESIGIGNGPHKEFNERVGPKYFNDIDNNKTKRVLKYFGKKPIPEHIELSVLKNILGVDDLSDDETPWETEEIFDPNKSKFVDPNDFKNKIDIDKNRKKNGQIKSQLKDEHYASPKKIQSTSIDKDASFKPDSFNPLQLASNRPLTGDLFPYKGADQNKTDEPAPHLRDVLSPHNAVQLAKPRAKPNTNMLKNLPEKGPERVKHDPSYNPFDIDTNGFEDMAGEVFVWKHQPHRKVPMIRAAGRAKFFNLEQAFEPQS